MKKFAVLLFVHAFFISFGQTLIINEISQGPSGSKEYVEFLVVPTGPLNPCQPNANCLDLRGWIFDDNNSYFTPGSTSGVGLAQGSLRFSNSAFWSCIPVGTLIVVYNDADINASLPGNDFSMNDGNCRLILPSSSGLIEGNANNPSAAAPLTYPLVGWLPGGTWSYTGMANTGDSYQIYAPINTSIPAHSVSWGNNNSNTIIYFIGPATASVYYFNGASNNPFLQNNWSSGSSPSSETPGAGNNAANTAYIQSLTNNCSPILPLTANPTAQNAVCTCNGAVNAAPSGGNGVYSYVWTNAQGQNVGNFANISNLCAGWYYLQVNSGGCSVNDSVQIINSGVLTNPSFTNFGPYCQGSVAASLPLTSSNGINGTWSPPTISTANSGSSVYTFTPNAGQCANNYTQTIVVNANTTPTFSTFGPYCQNAAAASLPISSNNGVNGTWSPPTISTANGGSTVYTFTPNAGQCANNYTQTVVVNANSTPTFSSFGPYCQNAAPASLPVSSNNGVNGTWSPPTISTANGGSTVYTFTPNAGQCANNYTQTVVVNANTTPTFSSFGPYCPSAQLPILPNLSNNGISGSWNPSTISTSLGASTYNFTPSIGQCANLQSITITITSSVLPSFSNFGPYCQNTPGVPLPNTSNNGISGTWLPPSVNTNVSGTGPYIFVPDAGQCGDTVVEQIQVNPAISPNFPNFGPYCLGDVAALASTSSNGISGTWNPPVLNTAQPGISAYNFTPNPGICALDTTISVEVVNPMIFAGNDTTLCAGSSLFLEASGGNNYQWSNGVIDGIPFTPSSSMTYTVCGTVGSCTGCDTVVVTVNPAPSASFIQDINGYDVQFLYMGTPVQNYTWDFGDGGNSSLMDPTHTYAGAGNYGVLLTVSNNGCTSTYFSEIELFAPGNDAHLINVITPNGDGINDAFDLQLEGYKKVTILILNRWGNIMQVLTGTQLTWDGMVNGNKAVEGVYFYRYDTLSYDGRTTSGHGFFHIK